MAESPEICPSVSGYDPAIRGAANGGIARLHWVIHAGFGRWAGMAESPETRRSPIVRQDLAKPGHHGESQSPLPDNQHDR